MRCTSRTEKRPVPLLQTVPYYKFQGDKKAQEYIFTAMWWTFWTNGQAFSLVESISFEEGNKISIIHAFDIETKTWGSITNIQYSTNTLIHKLQFAYGGIDLVRTQVLAFLLPLPLTVI